ncbi:hypothetical protein ACWDR2_28480 [Streptomyces sp. NPDC003631]|uniref:hypothetical protein n=1 Tax=Streptomyces sp. NPDC003737 TaxID=3364685 RepID=UPI00369155D9
MEIGYDVIEKTVGQLNSVELGFGIPALAAVADFNELDRAVRRIGDHQHGRGAIDRALTARSVMWQSDALFDLRAVVADLDKVDTTSGDDMHVDMLSAKAEMLTSGALNQDSLRAVSRSSTGRAEQRGRQRKDHGSAQAVPSPEAVAAAPGPSPGCPRPTNVDRRSPHRCWSERHRKEEPEVRDLARHFQKN